MKYTLFKFLFFAEVANMNYYDRMELDKILEKIFEGVYFLVKL